MADQRKTVAVVDGNSLLHRAFHAISANMTAPDGTPTNAVFGFMSMFVKLEERFKPWGIAVCFDKGRPRARMELLPAYKAQRPPMDPDLAVQFPLVKDLLAALSVPVVELEGWEGDDLLGTLAREGDEQGYDMLLVTGDRDMYQLSSDHVRVVSTRKGMSDVAVMTPEAVADLYGGITPERVPDFYGLKGDTSDNIPGVPGIGPKKAQQAWEAASDASSGPSTAAASSPPAMARTLEAMAVNPSRTKASFAVATSKSGKRVSARSTSTGASRRMTAT